MSSFRKMVDGFKLKRGILFMNGFYGIMSRYFFSKVHVYLFVYDKNKSIYYF